MVFMILSGAAFGVLAAVCWPSARLQRTSLGVLQRLLHLIVILAVFAAAMFFFLPDLTPGFLAQWVDMLPNSLTPALPEPRPGLVWLPVAGLVVAIALPVLAMVDFAKRLAGLTSMVQRLLSEIRTMAREMESTLAASERATTASAPADPQRLGDVKAAVQTMSAIAGNNPPARNRKRPLADFLG